jgi:hypothetical protein
MEAYRIHNDLNLKTWVEIETEYTGDLILNPVQDIIGDVYISIIEFNAIKDILEDMFADVSLYFTLQEFVPKPTPV